MFNDKLYGKGRAGCASDHALSCTWRHISRAAASNGSVIVFDSYMKVLPSHSEDSICLCPDTITDKFIPISWSFLFDL